MDLKPKKLAVLIDADNSSINSIEPVLEEIAKFGIASVKRVYGDWSSDTLKNFFTSSFMIFDYCTKFIN